MRRPTTPSPCECPFPWRRRPAGGCRRRDGPAHGARSGNSPPQRKHSLTGGEEALPLSSLTTRRRKAGSEIRVPAAEPSGSGHRGLEHSVDDSLPAFAAFTRGCTKPESIFDSSRNSMRRFGHLVKGLSHGGKTLEDGNISGIPGFGFFPRREAPVFQREAMPPASGIEVDLLPPPGDLLLYALQALKRSVSSSAERGDAAADAVLFHVTRTGTRGRSVCSMRVESPSWSPISSASSSNLAARNRPFSAGERDAYFEQPSGWWTPLSGCRR